MNSRNKLYNIVPISKGIKEKKKKKQNLLSLLKLGKV